MFKRTAVVLLAVICALAVMSTPVYAKPVVSVRTEASAGAYSGRNRLLNIARPVDFGDCIQTFSGLPTVMFSPRANESLASWTTRQAPHDIALLIGPEGGFSPEEAAAAKESGLAMCGLGRRILRTETAALFVLSCLSAAYEL